MNKEEIDIDEMINDLNSFRKDFKTIKEIKMKENFYNNLARSVQRVYSMVEVLDKDKQPLNRLYDIKVVIDNTIKGDYEIVYE